MKVRELMTTDVETVGPHQPLKEAARKMARRAVSGLPVIDDSGRLVGMLSEADFVTRASGGRRSKLVSALFERSTEPLDSETVGDIMTRDVVVVDPDATYTEAARLMDRKGVKRLPVVDRDGGLVGIVSRGDILGVFARDDAEIAAEIEQRICAGMLHLEPGEVSVAVEDGRVQLSGEVPTRLEARMLENVVSAVDGVLGVDSTVGYRVDDTRRSAESRPPGAPRPNW